MSKWFDPGNGLDPKSAYDEGADSYDDWAWQAFWRANELPLVMNAIPDSARAVLDVGCGTGFLLRRVRRRISLCVGVDVSHKMLRVAKRHLGRSVSLIQADGRHLPLADGAFDAVICARVLSHMASPSQVLSELARVAKVGGLIIVTDIDPEHDYTATTLPSLRGRIQVETYKHSPDALAEMAGLFSLSLREELHLGATTVAWLPPRDELTSIDRSGGRGVGFVMVFKKLR